MIIPNVNTHEICRLHQGKYQCRYLYKDDNDNLYKCARLQKSAKKEIDSLIRQKKNKFKGRNCNSGMTPDQLNIIKELPEKYENES